MNKLIWVLICFPIFALGHGTVVDATGSAVAEVLKQFKANEAPEVKKNFRGIKAWPAADKINAKIYINQANSEVIFNYVCLMDHSDGHDSLVCQKQ